MAGRGVVLGAGVALMVQILQPTLLRALLAEGIGSVVMAAALTSAPAAKGTGRAP